MDCVRREQLIHFRLHTHHLDRWYQKEDVERIAGACGFQNSPPGAWETALHNRIPALGQDGMRRMLEEDKILLQAWSFRGAPVVFPTAESPVFLWSLIPREGEPWIYTRGIQLALDFLQLSFDELLSLLRQVVEKLEGEVVRGKADLDQILAEWMTPLLPEEKEALWNSPSMYGNPEKQTVGGAVVSFLLRPCAFLGLVVFGKRNGISPTFTSFKSWTGHCLEVLESDRNPEKELVRKYLHCFGPGSVQGFTEWLGCSPAQARRMWQTAVDEMEPVHMSGKELWLLSDDKNLLLSPPEPERSLHLLGGHDPYLGLQDREVILEDKTKQRLIWQTVSNPGAVLRHGEIVGMWKTRKKGKGMDADVVLWNGKEILRTDVEEYLEDYAVFHGLRLNRIVLEHGQPAS